MKYVAYRCGLQELSEVEKSASELVVAWIRKPTWTKQESGGPNLLVVGLDDGRAGTEGLIVVPAIAKSYLEPGQRVSPVFGDVYFELGIHIDWPGVGRAKLEDWEQPTRWFAGQTIADSSN